MCGRILNEDDFVEIDDLVETDQFVPSSDFVLAVAISQKMTPSASALEERERQYDLQAQQSLTAAVFGDPRRSIGGELNKSESPVRVRMRKINSSRSRPIVGTAPR